MTTKDKKTKAKNGNGKVKGKQAVEVPVEQPAGPAAGDHSKINNINLAQPKATTKANKPIGGKFLRISRKMPPLR